MFDKTFFLRAFVIKSITTGNRKVGRIQKFSTENILWIGERSFSYRASCKGKKKRTTDGDTDENRSRPKFLCSSGQTNKTETERETYTLDYILTKLQLIFYANGHKLVVRGFFFLFQMTKNSHISGKCNSNTIIKRISSSAETEK